MVKAPILESITINRYLDSQPDLSYMKQDYFADHYTGKEAYMNVTQELNEKYKAQDAERLRKYNLGLWFFMGIEAVADINLRYKGMQFTHNISESIWGVESDSEEYVKMVQQEQIDIIKHQCALKGIGVSLNLKVIINEDVKN
jgi:hypothetical protein